MTKTRNDLQAEPVHARAVLAQLAAVADGVTIALSLFVGAEHKAATWLMQRGWAKRSRAATGEMMLEATAEGRAESREDLARAACRRGPLARTPDAAIALLAREARAGGEALGRVRRLPVSAIRSARPALQRTVRLALRVDAADHASLARQRPPLRDVRGSALLRRSLSAVPRSQGRCDVNTAELRAIAVDVQFLMPARAFLDMGDHEAWQAARDKAAALAKQLRAIATQIEAEAVAPATTAAARGNASEVRRTAVADVVREFEASPHAAPRLVVRTPLEALETPPIGRLMQRFAVGDCVRAVLTIVDASQAREVDEGAIGYVHAVNVGGCAPLVSVAWEGHEDEPLVTSVENLERLGYPAPSSADERDGWRWSFSCLAALALEVTAAADSAPRRLREGTVPISVVPSSLIDRLRGACDGLPASMLEQRDARRELLTALELLEKDFAAITGQSAAVDVALFASSAGNFLGAVRAYLTAEEGGS